jgi:hypothetical protein
MRADRLDGTRAAFVARRHAAEAHVHGRCADVERLQLVRERAFVSRIHAGLRRRDVGLARAPG